MNVSSPFRYITEIYLTLKSHSRYMEHGNRNNFPYFVFTASEII